MDEEFGPAMRALTEKQRLFVLAMAANPFGTAADWARDAGYSDVAQGAKVRACRMIHDPKIEKAVAEYARGCLQTVGPVLATAGIMRIAAKPDHPKHLQALEMLANRAGLHEKVEIAHTHRHTDLTGDALVARLKQLGQELQLDVNRLLGSEAQEMKLIEGEVVKDG